ncbi:uncharacterized protein LOC111314740 [Durio zibethinus]|uniref:Uncharacterized protein LOC111314740 n=1 Tax=Durio zibethinus TaxID=66656 RepID=A0A6P6B4U8_DURZI|nr:uncharacterized protein LOC111314740 [Durio zibethinus]
MALFFMATSLNPKPIPPPFLNPKHKHPFKLISFKSSCKTFAQSEGQGGGVKEEEPPASFSGSLSSTRTQLDLLEQLSSTSSAVDGMRILSLDKCKCIMHFFLRKMTRWKNSTICKIK